MSDAPENYQGPQPKIICLSNGISGASSTYPMGLHGWQWEVLKGKFLRAGIRESEIVFRTPDDLLNCRESFNTIISFGEGPLNFATGKRGIDKWHISPLDTLEHIRHISAKCIPTFDYRRLNAQPELGLYIDMAFRRAAEERTTSSYNRMPERYRLNPPYSETLALLDWIIANKPEIAVDVETGNGQINTVGFAWSESDAIAINVLPANWSDEEFWTLWSKINQILSDETIAKIFQNFSYDTIYFSSYAVRVTGPIYDTMWAQRFLWPELDMGLDNVGRIYTRRPYWKDDGRVVGEEGKKKDWGNVRDWPRHYLYNCRDTTGTFEAKQAQIKDLRNRGLAELFEKFVLRFTGPVFEMCSTGVPFDEGRRNQLKSDVETRINGLMSEFKAEIAPEDFSPTSPKQVKEYLNGKGFKIPKKRDAKTKTWKESTDAKSLGKLRIKHPDACIFGILLELSKLNKLSSSYVNFQVRPGENILRYSLTGVGTETGRMAGHCDPWGNGFNIQTIPRKGGIKNIFVAPEGFAFLECDLRQAESRFVAYDAADANLIRMLEDPTKDLHRYVAAEIFQKAESEVTKDERQLGKKSGHGANYSVKENTLIESCLQEMNLVLTKKEATNILESYHRLFPGIRKWHREIREVLRIDRCLRTPTGRERYFYGRFGDDMFREGYAYRPQSTIPDITNHLMLHLWEERPRLGGNVFRFLAQIHDSLLLLVPTEQIPHVSNICLDTSRWHPSIQLAGGKLVIPTEVKIGTCLGEMKEYQS